MELPLDQTTSMKEIVLDYIILKMRIQSISLDEALLALERSQEAHIILTQILNNQAAAKNSLIYTSICHSTLCV